LFGSICSLSRKKTSLEAAQPSPTLKHQDEPSTRKSIAAKHSAIVLAIGRKKISVSIIQIA
jgi:hypothetical protein